MTRRLSRNGFLGAWAVLAVIQVVVLLQAAQDPTVGLPFLIVAGIAQVLKFPLALFRLNDLGKPPIDALFFTFIPVANWVGFSSVLTRDTPEPAEFERRQAELSEQLGVLGAFGHAFSWMGRTAAIALPLTILVAVIDAYMSTIAMGWFDRLVQMDPASRASTGAVFGGVALISGGYGALQFMKRETASRGSWMPALLCVPALLLWICFVYFDAMRAMGIDPMVIGLLQNAWWMLWYILGGAFIVIVWVMSVVLAQQGESPSGAIGQGFSRLTDVAPVFAGRQQLVLVGLQFVIPGVLIALQWAFVSMAALLEPEKPAVRLSRTLVKGMRAQVFRVLLVTFIGYFIAAFGTVAVVDGGSVAVASMMDARQVSPQGLMTSTVAAYLVNWWSTLVMLLLFQDRVAWIRRKKAERAAA